VARWNFGALVLIPGDKEMLLVRYRQDVGDSGDQIQAIQRFLQQATAVLEFYERLGIRFARHGPKPSSAAA